MDRYKSEELLNRKRRIFERAKQRKQFTTKKYAAFKDKQAA